MRRSLFSFFMRKEQILLAIAAFAATALMSSNRTPAMDTPRVWILALVGAIGTQVSHVEAWFNLAEENARLTQLNAELTLRNIQLREAEEENKRLRELIGFTQETPLEFIPVRVTGLVNRKFVTSVVLDAGSSRGLRKNMPLLSYDGLVGRLYLVTASQAWGQLLTDPNFRVSGRVQRSRITGIVRPLSADLFALEQVPKRSDVRIGDAVVTSGLTEMYPGGVHIGTIHEVSEDVDGLFMKILLAPDVDFSKLEELFVVGWNLTKDEANKL